MCMYWVISQYFRINLCLQLGQYFIFQGFYRLCLAEECGGLRCRQEEETDRRGKEKEVCRGKGDAQP